MARPQQYNRDQVKHNAMNLFWRQGYNATNLPQLLKTTKLSRSSFYAAFGDKRQLFIECFAHYTYKMDALLRFIETSNAPAEAIYLYTTLALNNKNERANNGCLVVNSLLEFEDIDNELYQLAKTQIQKMDSAFKQCFSNAIQQKKFNTPLTPDILAKLLGVIIGGLQVKKRAELPQDDITTVLNAFVMSIGLTPFDPSASVTAFSFINNKVN